MIQQTDVLIIGGGVVGCSAAYFLRKQGVDVLVVDRGEFGSGASWAATGLLAPIRPFLRPDHPYMRLQLAALRLFPSFVEALEAESGVSVGYMPTGTLRVIDVNQVDRLRVWMDEWRQSGFAVDLLVDEELHRLEPTLAADISGAIYNPHEPQVNARKLMQAYAAAARHVGATLLPHRPVTEVLREGQRVVGVRTQEGNIACNTLIVAAGAWSALCGEWLDIELPVRPLRGQSLSLQPTIAVRHILFGEHVYLAPKEDGTVIVGATHENVGFDASTTPEGIATLLHAARKMVPSLATGTLQQSWAGLRPRTPDARPIIGLAPKWENVVLACGHGGFGMLLSAVTGQAVAELITTGNLPSMMQPFTSERFSQQASGAAPYVA